MATYTEVTTTMSILDVIRLSDAADAVFDAVNAPIPKQED
jgi:hypothetical protein